MISSKNEKICNITLISKVKEKKELKNLKKVIKYLRILSEEDVKKSRQLKIKIFKEEKDKEKKSEFKVIAPIIAFQYYSEDFKKLYSKPVEIKDEEYEGEDTPSNVDDKVIKQIESSDFSDDE